MLLGAVVGWRWLTWLAALSNVAASTGRAPWAVTVSWWWVLLGWLLLITPVGRMGTTVLVARVLLRGLRPGRYPRGGSTPPAAVVHRGVRRRGGGRQPGRRPVGALLRAGAGGQGRPGRRPALAAAGDGTALPRQGVCHRARGRPHRPLARRRRAARRAGPGRRGRHRRHPQHPRAGHPGRAERRGVRGLGRAAVGAPRRDLGGVPGGVRRRRAPPLARPARSAAPGMGGGVRRDRGAAVLPPAGRRRERAARDLGRPARTRRRWPRQRRARCPGCRSAR